MQTEALKEITKKLFGLNWFTFAGFAVGSTY